MSLPIIALTMGDPAGVGPELVLRALADPIERECCHLAVFGERDVLQRCAEHTGLPAPKMKRIPANDLRRDDLTAEAATLVEVPGLAGAEFEPARVAAACGQASYNYIQAAIDAALGQHVDAVTTAPINKQALSLAGIDYPGHTEMFAERAATANRWCMMQASNEITCSFVTTHVGYAEVPALLTIQRVLDTIELTHSALQQMRGTRQHLVVCGLNPHAGEHGLFGNREEETVIVPAIERAREQGISIEGPLPPDAAFLPWKRRETGAYVCMYHDQGHIPVKALAFDDAVNTTLGLDIVRTSVDHGTAFDIAWTGAARSKSLFAALRLACTLSHPPAV